EMTRGPLLMQNWTAGLVLTSSIRRKGFTMKTFFKFAFTVALSAAFVVCANAATPRDVQTFQTSAGVLKITPINHANALIEAGGKVIYIDPTKNGDFTGLPQADLILISHDHGDHVDHDLTSIKTISKADTEIWTPAAVHEFVTNSTVVGNGETKKWGPFTIESVPAY